MLITMVQLYIYFYEIVKLDTHKSYPSVPAPNTVGHLEYFMEPFSSFIMVMLQRGNLIKKYISGT